VGGFLVADPQSNIRSGEDCLSEYPALKMRDAIAASDRRPGRQAPLLVKNYDLREYSHPQ
jgi:hypothetical protein